MRIDSVRGAGTIAVLAMLLAARAPAHAQGPLGPPSPGSAFSIPTSQLLQPEELNRLLQGPAADKPLVLQVGSHLFYAQAHIAGSEYAGPGSQAAGLKQLQDR